MHNAVTDFLLDSLPAKRKKSQGGWISFNAPCCHHRGESMDKRSRGGVKLTETGGVSYHCFNCKFIASYTPGRYLNYKFRKLLSWLGATSNDIDHLVIEALRIKETVAPEKIVSSVELPTFPEIELPEESRSFLELLDFYILADKVSYDPHFMKSVEYISGRCISMLDYNFYVTTITTARLDRRIIIPFYWNKKIVGYSARMLGNGIPKYYTQAPSNFVFNMDKQEPTSKFVVVSEGPFDAMSIDGVAVLGNEITEVHADIIDSLEREVIVVAHADKAGTELIKAALKYGWTMSFPVWREKYKDINDAVIHCGPLYVLKSILASRETNPLKIKLRMRGLDYA